MLDGKKVDLRQLFQLPVRPIVVNDEETEALANQPEEQKTSEYPIVYHCAKLRKHMGQRFNEGGDGQGLDYADGFELIDPDTAYPDCLLKELMYDEDNPDKCELLLVVAMYNEGVEHFKNTMCGIANNLKTFVRYGIHPKKIAVAMIIDGVKPFFATVTGPENQFTRTFFNQFFDENMILRRFNVEKPHDCRLQNEEDHDEFAHIFMQNIVMDDEGIFPLQFFFTIKQKNRRKLNTHLWFFGGFCEFIQPNYVMLIDVGTKPLKNSLFFMYEAMKVNNHCAGCCGEIKPMNPNLWKLVVPAQEVEYKFSHIFDKALESIIGYITVLPGAFSAYRWEALQGTPLWADYFKSICHPEEMGPFMSNIYLAEDRVLCLSLVSKKDAAYTLRYVKGSLAETDVPESIAELMSQRRRWINGSWFALVDSLKNFSKVQKSDHGCIRKCAFYFQMCYYYISVIFSWFMVGMFFLVFSSSIKNEFGTSLSDVGTYLVLLYVAMLMIVFILALGVKPKLVNDMYKGLAVCFGLFMFLSFSLTVNYIFKDIDKADAREWARWAMIATFCMFIMNMFVNCCVSVIARGLFHFLFMIPTYVNIFLIYAICNTHDCSWGNRPDVMTAEERARVEEFEEFRARWTIIWALTNSGFGFTLSALDSENGGDGWYVYLIAIIGLGLLSLRTVGGVLYAIQERCFQAHLKRSKKNDLYRQFETGNKVKRSKSRMMNESTVTPIARTDRESIVSPGNNQIYSFRNSPDQSASILGSSQGISSNSESNESDESPSNESDDSHDENSDISEEDSEESHSQESKSGSEENSEGSAEEEEKNLNFMIKYAQDELNMSLSFLAEELGTNSERLRQIEDGEVEPDSKETQNLLAGLNKLL